jgi:tripartite-type tricarboxylate transporter receptor subunit TctC
MTKIISKVMAACFGLSLALGAMAQDFPTKPITLIVGTGAGGGFDLVARRLAQAMSKNLGQSIVVVNRPGSGSVVGTMAALNAPPDGYTLTMGGLTNMVFNAALYKKLPYDPMADFVPIGIVAETPYVMVSRRELTQGDVASVVRYAKANPGKLNIGNAGAGTGQQVLAVAFAKEAGIEVVNVPYQGAQAVYTDLLGGRVDLFVDSLPSARGVIDSKRVNALYVTGRKRDALYPNIPTAREVGLPESEVTTWYGLFAPSKIPPAVLNRLHKAMGFALKDNEMKTQLETAGFQTLPYVPAAETQKFVLSEYKKWTQFIRSAGITLD